MADVDHVSSRYWQTTLLSLVESYDWNVALSRALSHPHEASSRGPRGRTALHVACEHDAPAILVEALLSAYPEASSMVGTSDMTPLHITCSSQHASVDVVQVLLEGSVTGSETAARDIDGDTPLHAACRCGAPIEVLEVLLEKDPSVVRDRDNEGLTPLLRLWVRYFVTLGDDVIDNVRCAADLNDELEEAWRKSTLLLRVAHHRSIVLPDSVSFRAVHAAAATDCPRAVLKIAIALCPNQLEERDELGRVPLIIAATTPVYKVHDLSESGYCFEDDRSSDDENPGRDPNRIVREDGTILITPPVIDVIVGEKPDLASVPDVAGRLPLNVALESGKNWHEGVKNILSAHPVALSIVDPPTRLYPFMLSAVGNSGCFQLNTIFELLRANPELVRCGLPVDNRNSCNENRPRANQDDDQEDMNTIVNRSQLE